MNWYWGTLGALAVWRVTHLFQGEDGPFDVLVSFRTRVGDGVLGRLFACFYCLSLWVAVPFAWMIGESRKEQLLLWLAFSAAAILVERMTAAPIVHVARVAPPVSVPAWATEAPLSAPARATEPAMSDPAPATEPPVSVPARTTTPLLPVFVRSTEPAPSVPTPAACCGRNGRSPNPAATQPHRAPGEGPVPFYKAYDPPVSR